MGAHPGGRDEATTHGGPVHRLAPSNLCGNVLLGWRSSLVEEPCFEPEYHACV